MAVGGGSSFAGTLAAPSSGAGSTRLAKGLDGLRRRVRNAEVARANPWVRAAVNARTSVASRVPIHVFVPSTMTVNGTVRHYRERVRAGSALVGADLAGLMVTPSPARSGRRWARTLLGDVLVHGNALLEEVTARGRLRQLVWQPWVDVKPHISPDGLSVEAYEVPTERHTGGLWTPGVRGVGPTRMLDRDAVTHLVVEDDLEVREGPIGISPIESLAYTHALHDAAMRFALHYLDNGIFPTGAVELDKSATPELARATRELLAATHAGVEQGGAPLVFAGKWHQISATPDGAKLIELAKFSREEVAAGFGMSLQQLGELSGSNRATAQVGRETFVRDVVGSDVALLETEFNAQLVGHYPRLSSAGVFVEGQLAEQLRPDLEARSRIHARSGRWMVPNEVRHVENLPPIDDPRADELTFDPGTPTGEDDREPEPEDDPGSL